MVTNLDGIQINLLFCEGADASLVPQTHTALSHRQKDGKIKSGDGDAKKRSGGNTKRTIAARGFLSQFAFAPFTVWGGRDDDDGQSLL